MPKKRKKVSFRVKGKKISFTTQEKKVKKQIRKAAFERGLGLGAAFLPFTIDEGRKIFIERGKKIKKLKAQLKNLKRKKRKR